MLLWGVTCNMIESTINALFLQSPPSHSDVLWSTSSADIQTWLTLCAAPGPNQTSSTWQPLKCPVRSSSAMTLLFTHHTHTHTGLCGYRRRGWARSFPRTLVPLFAICAEQQKSHETAASSRGCAERGGGLICTECPENTAESPAGTVPSLLNGTGSYGIRHRCHFSQPLFSSSPRSGPARTGTPPDASVRWKLQLKSITAEIRKCLFTCAALHRAPSTPQRHQKTINLLLFCADGVPGALTLLSMRCSSLYLSLSSSRGLSALFPSFSCSLSGPQARIHGSVAACTRCTRGQRLAGRWWRAWQEEVPCGCHTITADTKLHVWYGIQYKRGQ